jgi:hypothetical protein
MSRVPGSCAPFTLGETLLVAGILDPLEAVVEEDAERLGLHPAQFEGV